MADPFVAEIRVVGFNFAPTGWAMCNGQVMPISQNTALFSLLGTMYGGDGKSTFALPNVQGQAVISPGQGPGLTAYLEGHQGGSTSVTLLNSEMPLHSHSAQAQAADPAESNDPAPNRSLSRSAPGNAWQSNASSNLTGLAPQALSVAGGGLPHNNLPPHLVLNFVIALQGVFPPRA